MPNVAVCQVGTIPLAPEENRATLRLLCETAAADGADIVVLPELAASGYVLERKELLEVAEPVHGPTMVTLTEVAAAAGCVIILGFAERSGESIYNSAIVIDADGVVASHYRKLHLFGREKQCFAPGDLGLPIADTAFGRIATCICYDLRFPEVMRLAALRNADLLAVPTAWVGGFDAPNEPQPVSSQAAGAILQANLNQVFVACASQAGCPGDIAFLGNSLVCSPYGTTIVGPLPADVNQTVLANLDWKENGRAQKRSELITPRADRRTDVYGIRYEGADL